MHRSLLWLRMLIMKKTIFLLLFFIIYTLIIKFCPIITEWDKAFIIYLQNLLKDLPLIIPQLPDCKLYSIMIAFPLIVGGIYFFKQKTYLNIAFLASIPLITFLLNCIIKPIVQRMRPPYELQLLVHPHSFSYVSSHSLVTFCLWSVIIYLVYKHCQNIVLKALIITISVLWILFVGFSRIWLGVHHLTDVLAAYLLGYILVSFYVKLFSVKRHQ